MLQAYFSNQAAKSPLAPIVVACRKAIVILGVCSGVINMLTLTGSIFMMQVYDRVLGSQSIPTLVGLSVLAIGAYLFQGWLEALRSRILTLIGEKMDADLSPKLHTAGLRLALASPTGTQEALQSFRDLEAIRTFITGQGIIAAFDMPWLFLYVGMATLLHPVFGVTVLVSAVFLVWLTWKTEQKSKAPAKEAFESSVRRNAIVEANIRGAETITANGMRANRAARLLTAHTTFLSAQRTATFIIGGYGSAAKTVRMILQSFVLGMAAYLVIKGQISAGAIIAASIIIARALAPIDQAIAGWRPFVAARDGHERLTKLLLQQPSARKPFNLKPPTVSFAVKDLAVAAPGSQTLTITGVSFALEAGKVLGVIGASGSGKSTLAKALVGAWRPARGSIAFDDSGPEQWTEEELGAAIGYLPQDVQMFEGTVAENIARFDPAATDEKIERAALAAGLDTYIRTEFPKTGYNQVVFPGGANLAGGFRQRLGLARALYGDPFLVVLDEPNSNLDAEGETALAAAIKSVKDRRGIVIVVSHRMSLLAEVETLLTMFKGQAEFLGPRDAVYKRWLEKHQPNKVQPERPAAVKLVDTRPSAAPAASAPRLAIQNPQPQQSPTPPPVTPPPVNGANGTAAHHAPPPTVPAPAVRSWSTAPLRLTKPGDKRGR